MPVIMRTVLPTTSLVTVSLLLCLSIELFAEEYEVGGRLVYALGMQNSQLKTNCIFNFKIWVSDCKWLIRTENTKTGDIKYNEDSYDGKYVYSLSVFVDEKVKAGDSSSSGIVESNSIPDEASFYAQPIWLAFASSCYFNAITNGMIQPIWHLSDLSLRNKRYSIRGSWVRYEKAPFLPKNVSYCQVRWIDYIYVDTA